MALRHRLHALQASAVQQPTRRRMVVAVLPDREALVMPDLKHNHPPGIAYYTHCPACTKPPSGYADRAFSIGVWAWLAIVEKEADKLSESGQTALALLREDLERMATDKA